MNRRNFVGMAALTASVLIAPHVVARESADLIRNPEPLLGQRFKLANGKALQLARVQKIGMQAKCEQWQLDFTCDEKLADGIYELQGTSSNANLYLQATPNGMLACIGRLV